MSIVSKLGPSVTLLVVTASAGLVSLAAAAATLPRVQVGSEPLNVVAVGRKWLATENYAGGSVSIVNSRRRRVVRSVRVGGSPGGIAYGAGALWVSDLSSGTLTRLTVGGRITGHVRLPGSGAGVAVHEGIVYVADNTGGLNRVQAASLKPLASIALPGQPEAVVVAFGMVWVTNANGTINVVDPVTGSTSIPAIRVGSDVDDITATSNAIWAVTLYGRRLVRINPMTRKITKSIRLRGQGSGVLATAKAIWVANYDLGSVSRVNPVTGRIVRTYRVGVEPRGLAVSGGSVWVANQGSDSISQVASP